MLVRPIKLEVLISAFAIITCLGIASTAQSQSSTKKTESGEFSGGQSVVDSIQIIGDPSLTEAAVFEALEIVRGESILRSTLNEALSRAEQRLRLSGNYKSVELRLNKGSQRNHYKLEATVALLDPTYFGVNFMSQEKKKETYDDWDNFDDKSKKAHLGGYVGSRNFLALGLRADFEVTGAKTSTEKKQGQVFGEEFSSVLSLLKPAASNGAFFYGTNLIFFYSNDRSESGNGEDFGSKSHYQSETYLIQPMLGIRRGFTTFTLAPARYFNWSRNSYSYGDSTWDPETDEYTSSQKSETNHNSMYATFLSLNMRYSEKTYLAALEPGLEFAINASQIQFSSFTFKTLATSLANTWLFGSSHGLRPTAVVQYSWDSFDDDSILEKEYDVGVRYDFVTKWDWVFGVDRSIYGKINPANDQRYEKLPTWRNGLFARYVSATFGAEIALLYGHEGLSDQHFVYSTSSNRRTQP